MAVEHECGRLVAQLLARPQHVDEGREVFATTSRRADAERKVKAADACERFPSKRHVRARAESANPVYGKASSEHAGRVAREQAAASQDRLTTRVHFDRDRLEASLATEAAVVPFEPHLSRRL